MAQQITSAFLLKEFSWKNEQGQVTSLDYLRLSLAKAKVSKAQPIEGFDAVEEKVTLYGVKFKVVTTFGPNGSEVSAFQI